MARPIEVRPSYNNDSSYLNRLAVAVSKDEKQPMDWRRETQITINNLIRLLNEANDRKIRG